MNIVLTSQFKLYSGLLMISQSIFVFSAPYLDTLNYAINDFSDRFLVREVRFERMNSDETRNSTIAFDMAGHNPRIPTQHKEVR
jgi:hypothetical protein